MVGGEVVALTFDDGPARRADLADHSPGLAAAHGLTLTGCATTR
jgi:hypothetical protein